MRRILNQNGLTAATLGILVTPSPNALLISSISVRRNGALPSAMTCVDDAGNTWTKLTDCGFFAANGVRGTQWSTRVGANPGSFTVTGGSVSGTSIGIAVIQYQNASSDLSNVASGTGNAAGDPSATLPFAPTRTGHVLSLFTVLTSTVTIAMPPGFTELAMLAAAGQRGQIASAPGFGATALPWISDGLEAGLGAVEIKLA